MDVLGFHAGADPQTPRILQGSMESEALTPGADTVTDLELLKADEPAWIGVFGYPSSSIERGKKESEKNSNEPQSQGTGKVPFPLALQN